MLRWIAFDAVGTLITPAPAVADVYAAIGRKFGSRLTADELRPHFRSVFEASAAACLPTADRQILTNEALEARRWRWIVDRLLPDVAEPDACFTELYEHFAQPRNWRMYDDVRPVLKQLRADGLRLALASNFDRRLYDVCKGFPGLQSVEKTVISTEVGACKPSSKFFAGLLETCGCRPEELLMVGDEELADVTGPTACGIRSLLIDRSGAKSSPLAIQSLFDLPQMLDSLNAGKPMA